MARIALSLAAAAAALGVAFSAHAEGGAQAAAAAWLQQIDQGDYAQAWSDADPLVQGVIAQGAFVQSLTGVRGPLGALQTRKLTASRAAKTLPGTPDGTYDVLTFSSRFENKEDAVETVIMRKEDDGWKPSGYHLR